MRRCRTLTVVKIEAQFSRCFWLTFKAVHYREQRKIYNAKTLSKVIQMVDEAALGVCC